MRTLIALLLMAVPVSAQITVPAEHEPFDPIIATVTAPPDANVVWSKDPLTKIIVHPDGRTIYCWAGPGTHTLTAEYTVSYSATFTVKPYSVASYFFNPMLSPQVVGGITGVILLHIADASPYTIHLIDELSAQEERIHEGGMNLMVLSDQATDGNEGTPKLVTDLLSHGVALPALFVLDSDRKILLQQHIDEDTTAEELLTAMESIE